MLLHIVSALVRILVWFPWLSQPRRDIWVQAWAATMLARIGVELRIAGSPPATGPMLLVANHTSWLDIVVLHAARHCRFVSKADVKHWPVVSTLATASGTLFVERASPRDAMRVVHQMAQALKDGEVLAVFPEGTTGDGNTLLPFHANLLQAAISAAAPVQPVALRYVDGQSGTPSRAVSYTGGEPLGRSLWRTLCARQLCVQVTFGVPQLPAGRNRRAWAQDLRAAVAEMRQS